MNWARVHAYLAHVGGGSPMFRLCLLLLVWSSCLFVGVPESTFGNLLKDAPIIGWTMFAITSASIVETLLNDFLPDRFHWEFALKWRHISIMICAGFFLSLIFLITQSKISNLIMPYYVVMAFFLVWNAYLDIWRRYGPGRTLND